MFRNLFFRSLLVPLFQRRVPLAKVSYLPLYFFADKKNPQAQTFTQLDMVCQQISDISKNPKIDKKKLKDITMLLQSLQTYEKQSVINLFMTTLIKHEKSYGSNNSQFDYFSDEIVKNLIQDQYFLRTELLLNQIAKLKAKEKETGIKQEKINDHYLQIYKDVIPLAKDIEKIKIQSLFFKSFSRHLIENNQKTKGLEILLQSIEQHKKLIVEEYHKYQFFTTKSQKDNSNSNQKKDANLKQKEELRSNAMKENIRRLIESLFEILYYYYCLERQELRKLQGKQKEKESKLLDVLSQINEGLKNAALMPGIRTYSRYFHRLSLINYELEYAFAKSKKREEKAKDVLKMMKQFYKESFYDLEDSTSYIEVQKEISLALMSMQMHLSMAERKSKNQVKDDLVVCSKKIIEDGKFETNWAAKSQMMKLFGDFIRKNNL